MRAVDLVIVTGWVAFWGYWLISARNVKSGQNRWNRLIGVRVAAIVLLVFLARFTGFDPHKATGNWARAGVGVALWAAGLALAVWARIVTGACR